MDWAQFQKPQRYIGNEWNVVSKSHQDRLKVCLCFPDMYEVGMSNLGVRIIYGLLNEYEQLVCERVFSPGPDLAAYLEKTGKKLFSLESKTALDQFDVVGFHLGCELNFTNFLSILHLAGIPLYASERKDTIVMAGGLANPEPIAPFVDVVFLGEFEAKADEFVEILKRHKDRKTRLEALAQTEGFYVPGYYATEAEGEDYRLVPKHPSAVVPLRKAYVKDLNTSYYPTRWLTPYTQIVHDRAQVEIARGCPHNCYFCQARCVYYPYREKKTECVLRQMEQIYKTSGYENFSLLALSASHHSHIEQIIDGAGMLFKEKRVGIALPSLRVDDIIGRLYPKLAALKKVSLTLALEAGTVELRQKINKHIDVKAVLDAKDVLRSLNLRSIKLYFMFGLPGETDDDLISMARMIRVFQKTLGIKVNASINIFIPKPFSRFQDVQMESEENLKRKRNLIQKELGGFPPRWYHISFASQQRSILEAVLSRAGREIAPVIYRAFHNGARFDSCQESFRWDIWKNAFCETGIDYHRYTVLTSQAFRSQYVTGVPNE